MRTEGSEPVAARMIVVQHASKRHAASTGYTLGCPDGRLKSSGNVTGICRPRNGTTFPSITASLDEYFIETIFVSLVCTWAQPVMVGDKDARPNDLDLMCAH